jgi:hypothetical protein
MVFPGACQDIAAAVTAVFAAQPRSEHHVTMAGPTAPHAAARRDKMSISAIAPSAPAASLYSGLSSAIVSQVTSTNGDSSTITITTTYANGTISTATQAAPPSTVTTRLVVSANADGSQTLTTYYADGRTPTTQTNPNPPPAANSLDPHNPVQKSVLLWV